MVAPLQYCADVLLQEVIIQILLWRLRKRASVELGSPEAETELRESGARIAAEKDIVLEVMGMRTLAEEKMKRGISRKKVGGTESRPKYVTTT